MKLTTTRNLIAKTLRFETKCNICLELTLQTIANLTRSCKLAFLTLEWRSIWTDINRKSWRLELDCRQSLWRIAGCDRVTNACLAETSKSYNIARNCHIGFLAAKTAVSKETINLAFDCRTVDFHNCDIFVLFELATENLANCIFAKITVGGKCGHKQLCALRRIRVNIWLWNLVNNCVKDSMQVIIELRGCASLSVARNRVVDWILELLFACCELEEKVGNFVFNFTETCGRLINLVYDDNWLQIHLKRLLQDKLRLWHWTFLSIDYQNDTVRHVERTFHLARKVGVAWRIDNVDFITVVINRGLFCGNGNTAFMFLIARVHNERLTHFRLVVTESVALLQKRIHQGSFTVVDVRNNRDVAKLTFILHIALL